MGVAVPGMKVWSGGCSARHEGWGGCCNARSLSLDSVLGSVLDRISGFTHSSRPNIH